MAWKAIGFGLALALAACSRPNLYLLPSPAPVGAVPSPVASVVVAEISLPAYAESLEIAELQPDGALRTTRSASWADNPRRALTRHLVASLEARLGSRVAAEPWPGFDQPGMRVEVIVDRLVGAPGTGVEFAGQYVVVTPESGRIFASERFAIRVPPQGEGFQGLAGAHARAIEQLADQIAARITGRPVAGAVARSRAHSQA